MINLIKRNRDNHLNEYNEQVYHPLDRFRTSNVCWNHSRCLFIHVWQRIGIDRSIKSQCQVEIKSHRVIWLVFFSLSLSMFVCPSTCFTQKYRSNYQLYPLIGNEIYSGVRNWRKKNVFFLLIFSKRIRWFAKQLCMTVDWRRGLWRIRRFSFEIIPFNRHLSKVHFETAFSRVNHSVRPISPINSLRVESMVWPFFFILHSPSFFSSSESSIPDIAIEHRQYLYNRDQSSSISCRSKLELKPIEPIPVDQGCRTSNLKNSNWVCESFFREILEGKSIKILFLSEELNAESIVVVLCE